MNESEICNSTKMDESSDEDGKLLKLQPTPKKVCPEIESKGKDCVDSNKTIVKIPISLNEILKNDSEYLIYHPPKYTLAPYKDPKLSSLSLRDQVKVVCSYHALISRSIANQAKIQIDSCSYPEPIEPIQKKTISSDVINDELREGDNSGDKPEEYISRAGRITKRKFYSETDDHKKVRIHKAECDTRSSGNSSSKLKKNVSATENYTEELALKILESSLQDGVASPKGNEDEVPSKKKAPPPPARNRNLRQRQLKFDCPETETEAKKKSSSKSSSPSSTLKQQKRSSDGFVEPAAPGVNKRAARKTIQCPICDKFFPEKEIEQHASSCGEIAMDVGSANHLNVNGIRCHSCKKVLISEEDYEIHCTTCNGGPSYLN